MIAMLHKQSTRNSGLNIELKGASCSHACKSGKVVCYSAFLKKDVIGID